MNTLKLTLAVLLIAGAAAIVLVQHQTQALLLAQNACLRQQVELVQANYQSLATRAGRAKGIRAPRLPAPAVQFAVPPPEPAGGASSSNLLARFPGLKAKAPNRLSAGQLASYLQANGRNAASLLAAYRTSGDPALLQEALQQHGNDPQVALEAALRKDASPEERREWLDTFKQSDPANALPNYLLALDDFKAGQSDQAVQELLVASGKPQFDDYLAQRARDDEQAYLAAGYPLAEVKAMAPLQQALDWTSWEEAEAVFGQVQSQTPQLQQTKELAQNVMELAKSYQQAGDQASAEAAIQIVVNLAQRYSSPSNEDGLNRLVGGAAEIMALSALDPNSACDGAGQTVQDRISLLKQQRQAIRGLYQQAVPMLTMMSDQDWISYSDRARAFGEPAALQWVVGKYGQPSP